MEKETKLGFFAVLILLMLEITTAKIEVSFPPPSNCSTSCGNISIEYPFGIGDGCFRPGLNLTCDNNTRPPKLYLGDGSFEIKSINVRQGYVLFDSPVTVVSNNQPFYNGIVTQVPKYGPYALSLGNSSTGNYIWVFGCNIYVELLLGSSGNPITDCATICFDRKTISCDGNIGCCRFFTGPYSENKSYGIQLTRMNSSVLQNATFPNDTNILVFFTHNNSMNINYEDLITLNSSTKMEAQLFWYMDDQLSCEYAMENDIESYACKSANSACLDAYNMFGPNNGYFCQCPSHKMGNPYLSYGCEDSSSTFLPNNRCLMKCGDMNIPYPFGLVEGCYRDANFAVRCDQLREHSIPIIDNFDMILQVTNISLQEGQIWVTPYDSINTTYPFWPFRIFKEQEQIYNWVIDYQSCNDAKQNMTTYACKSDNSSCHESHITIVNQMGYRCKCIDGYDGNPYIPGGCQDIDECADPVKYPCKGNCKNSIGNYSCFCPPGTSGDPELGPCLPHKKNNKGVLLGVVIGVSVGLGLLPLTIGFIFLLQKWQKQREKQLRDRFFKQNHGLLLQQLISSNEDVARKTRIFSLEELEKATNNFDETRILGRGGHGIVYKGILSDQRVVAIKRSKIVVKSEINQFINEVAVLTQINHRNIVSLFGCCLETEVPLLVYQFISNGTLSYHLHTVDQNSRLAWHDRLRIATETARALAYLHSAASISIFHRDVKSSNILLDDYFTAKVSDFGASRFIPLDQTHVLTDIQGTFGYMDPEYFRSGQLKEKSDVYSFGVVLVELLTGQRPTSLLSNDEERSVLMYFLQAIKDNSIFQFIEDQIVEQGTQDVIKEVIQIAEECLKLEGKERPTMKELEFHLQMLANKEKGKPQKWTSGSNEETKYFLSDFFQTSESQSSVPFQASGQYITSSILDYPR